MHRAAWLFLLLLLLSPRLAQAIQLHWVGGSTDITVSSNTQALLVVQADSAVGALPNSWHFQWTADSLGLQFSAFNSSYACLVDTAKVDSIAAPQTPADSAANQITAWCCSAGSNNAGTGYFLVDVPAGGHGNIRVVALDPADSTNVLSSNNATFNGGVDGDFSPTILSATSTHETTQLRVSLIGTGLSAGTSLRVTAPDGLWSIPLTVTRQTGSLARSGSSLGVPTRGRRAESLGALATTMTAVADVPALLPSAVIQSGDAPGAIAIALLAADQPIPVDDSSLPDTVLFRDLLWTDGWYPKDFSFYYNVVPSGNPLHPWKGLFHLMYIRARPNDAGSELAHAWSSNLVDWQYNLHAFLPRHDGGWEDQAVWAPTVVPVGDSTVMFYTGVDPFNNQRIGYAKTAVYAEATANGDWVRQPSACYEADSTSWADPDGRLYNRAQQFRDPFVMEDPDSAGRYLMFVVGEDKAVGASTAVGVARNYSRTLDHWLDLGSYAETDSSHAGVVMVKPGVASVVESPLAMRDSAGTGPWRIFFANAHYDTSRTNTIMGDNSTFFITETLGGSVANTRQEYWPSVDNLWTYLYRDGSLIGWQACEHLQVGTMHLFAGYNGDGIAITRTYWDPSTGQFKIGHPPFIGGVPGPTPIGGIRLYLVGYRPGQPGIRVALETPSCVVPRLELYDVAGRRVRTLSDGKPSQGRQEWLWDCRDEAGQAVASGVYFARMTGVGAPRVLRVAVVK